MASQDGRHDGEGRAKGIKDAGAWSGDGSNECRRVLRVEEVEQIAVQNRKLDDVVDLKRVDVLTRKITISRVIARWRRSRVAQ